MVQNELTQFGFSTTREPRVHTSRCKGKRVHKAMDFYADLPCPRGVKSRSHEAKKHRESNRRRVALKQDLPARRAASSASCVNRDNVSYRHLAKKGEGKRRESRHGRSLSLASNLTISHFFFFFLFSPLSRRF